MRDMVKLKWLITHYTTTGTQSCLWCLLRIKWLFYDVVSTNISDFFHAFKN